METTFWFTGPFGARFYATLNTDEAEAVLSDIGANMNDLRPAYRSIANGKRMFVSKEQIGSNGMRKSIPVKHRTSKGKK